MANALFTCTLNTSVSGGTISASMTYARTDGLSYTYQDTNFPNPTMTVAGRTFTDTAFGNAVRAGVSVGSVTTTTFSVSGLANGTYAASFTAGSGLRSDFAGTWSANVTVTGGSTAPSIPQIVATNVQDTTATITYTMPSWGNPSTGRFLRYYGTTSTTTGHSAYLPSAAYQSDRTYTETLTGLTPETTYYVRARGENSSLSGSFGSTFFTTRQTYTLYGPVNAKSRGIVKLYGSVDGKSVEVKKLYGSVGGKSKLIFEV